MARARSWHAATRRGALQLAQIQARKASRDVQRASSEHGLINYKDAKAKCCHLKTWHIEGLCGRWLSEYVEWRYSKSCWYFRPSFVNYCPTNLLSGLIPPPPPVHRQCMAGGGGGGWGVLNPVGDHNIRRSLILCIHRVGRVLSFFSSRRNWDSPIPSPAGEWAPPPFGSGGRGTLASERGGGRVPIPTRGHTLWYSVNMWYFVSVSDQIQNLKNC